MFEINKHMKSEIFKIFCPFQPIRKKKQDKILFSEVNN